MINRLLIRIKVAQLIYAYLESDAPDYTMNEELSHSLESSYKLYNYLLSLVVNVTDYRAAQIEAGRRKYMPTHEERYPNMRFVENRVADYVRRLSGVMQYCEEHGLASDFDTDVYRAIWEGIQTMPGYGQYMTQSGAPTFDDDRRLWVDVFNTVVPDCAALDQMLESRDLYWNDDLTTITTFVVKTLKRISPDDEQMEVLPMYRSDDDRRFAVRLLAAAIEHAPEAIARVDKVANNWEAERIAMMDKAIMVCAVAEVLTFPDIAVAITLNEYIELAKHYSSPESAKFINGILDKVVAGLRAEGVIFKA